jgi:S1-C subfamily serine protease
MVPRPLPDGQKLAREFFQMEVSELNETVASKFNYRDTYPIMIIIDVERGGVADQAGLQPGDLISQVNNATVRNLREFSLEMEKISEGDAANFGIMRITLRAFGQIQRQYVITLKAQRKQLPSRRLL